jgi:poly(A) polymerase
VAYFAGGCVRDELLGLHPTDYDIATDATPAKITQLFPRTSSVGAAFGVVLAHVDAEQLPVLSDQVSIEVATFRADGPYSDARRPDAVTFSDARSDAARRDFTINALFLDPLAPPEPSQVAELTAAGFPTPSGNIIDLVGGVHDLRARVLRAVGDPDQRLAEDHLRALRAVRFSARLGFHIDPGTANAIRRHASSLRGVSRERIGEELRRMFAHPRRAHAAAWLQRLSLDAPVLDEQATIATPDTIEPESILPRLAGLAAHQPLNLGKHPQRRGLPGAVSGANFDYIPCFSVALAAWILDRTHPSVSRECVLSDVDGVIRRLRKALCLSNEETADMTGLFKLMERIAALSQEPSQGRAGGVFKLRKVGASPSLEGACAIMAGVDPGRIARLGARLEILAGDDIGLFPQPLVTGDDLVALGMKPGPLFKRVLDEVWDRQLDGDVRTREQAMELVTRLRV